MNMDYSKVFELLNQDAEKERNKKAEKAVHDNLYNKGFRDGLAVLNKIRAEIEKLQGMCDKNDLNLLAQYSAFGMVLDILDKYKEESEGV